MLRKYLDARKAGALLTTLLICLVAFACNLACVWADASTVEVNSYEELAQAVASMTDDSNLTIKLGKDIETDKDLSVSKGSLTLLGEGHSMTFKGFQVGVGVSGNAVLNLGKSGAGSTLIVEGDGTQDDSLIALFDSAVLNMYDGTTIRKGTSSNNASAV